MLGQSMQIAVIGAGVSGSLAARLLSAEHEVTLFEANAYPGGHANTVDVQLGDARFAVDTGFMVFNRQTYPHFSRLLQLLKIPSRRSDMSFSVQNSNSGLEYQGSSINGLFAQRRNAFSPAFCKMLLDIVRFNRCASAAVATGEIDDRDTVGDFLQRCNIGSRFVDNYLVPMSAAIWSANPESILGFPAKFMLGFFRNHGLIQISNRPQWLTIPGGSRRYVAALLAPLGDRLRLGCPVAAVTRSEDGVTVVPEDGPPERFDQVVMASHADQTLRMLADATAAEQEVLQAFPYQKNEAVLHTDTSMMPSKRRAWASWNYRVPCGDQQSASVTYDLSRLQKHDSPEPILLTLNETESIDPTRVIRRFTYHHPGYGQSSIDAQRRHAEVSGVNNTHFCGAYWGYGFHEDGVKSALAVARTFGLDLDSCTAASTREPSATVAIGQ